MDLPILIFIAVVFICLLVGIFFAFRYGRHRGYQLSREMYTKENKFIQARKNLEKKPIVNLYPLRKEGCHFVLMDFPRSPGSIQIFSIDVEHLVDLLKSKEPVMMEDKKYIITNVLSTDDEIQERRIISIEVDPV